MHHDGRAWTLGLQNRLPPNRCKWLICDKIRDFGGKSRGNLNKSCLSVNTVCYFSSYSFGVHIQVQPESFTNSHYTIHVLCQIGFLHSRSSHPNLVVHVLLVQMEGLLEHTSKFSNLLLESLLVGPSQAGVKKFSRDTIQGGWYLQVEDSKMLELSFGKLTRVYSVDNATSELKRAALPTAEFAASPTSVNEPAVNLVFGHAFGKHLGVASRLWDNSSIYQGPDWNK